MEIQRLDHVEFYVGDAYHWASTLCAGYGFTLDGQAGPETGLPGQRSLLIGQGTARIVLTSALNREHAAAEYTSRHGDGVAAMAFLVPDAADAFRQTVDRGAVPVDQPVVLEHEGSRVVVASVLGFGDVLHRFVERTGEPGAFLPGRMDMLAPAAGEALFEEIDHAAVCVPAGELGPTVEFYERVFGFTQIFEDYIEVGEQAMDSKVVQSPGGAVTLTLIEPVLDRAPGQIDEFLARHDGAGVQHLALRTTDIIGAVRTLESRGVRFLETPSTYYDDVRNRLPDSDLEVAALAQANVLIDRDHWGELYQIFAQSTHIRRSYFWEVVDRHGARTFGSGNIKALYAAKALESASAA